MIWKFVILSKCQSVSLIAFLFLDQHLLAWKIRVSHPTQLKFLQLFGELDEVPSIFGWGICPAASQPHPGDWREASSQLPSGGWKFQTAMQRLCQLCLVFGLALGQGSSERQNMATKFRSQNMANSLAMHLSAILVPFTLRDELLCIFFQNLFEPDSIPGWLEDAFWYPDFTASK